MAAAAAYEQYAYAEIELRVLLFANEQNTRRTEWCEEYRRQQQTERRLDMDKM